MPGAADAANVVDEEPVLLAARLLSPGAEPASMTKVVGGDPDPALHVNNIVVPNTVAAGLSGGSGARHEAAPTDTSVWFENALAPAAVFDLTRR